MGFWLGLGMGFCGAVLMRYHSLSVGGGGAVNVYRTVDKEAILFNIDMSAFSFRTGRFCVWHSTSTV